MIYDYWVSSKRMTGFVRVEDNIIIETMPILKKFIGQPFQNLKQWLKKFGEIEIEELSNTEF